MTNVNSRLCHSACECSNERLVRLTKLAEAGKGEAEASERAKRITIEDILRVQLSQQDALFCIEMYETAIRQKKGGKAALKRVELFKRILELLRSHSGFNL